LARISSWPAVDGTPRLLGFAGYMAGMTHAMLIDFRKESTTSGQEVQVPVTILEVPPLKVAAVRLYKETPYGLKTITEIWADKLESHLARRTPIPKKPKEKENPIQNITEKDFDEVRVIVHTQPYKVTGVPSKSPELMEIGLGGGKLMERLDYAKSLIGKEVKVGDFTKEGSMVDVVSITKAKGFQGVTKRWRPKLNPHKNSKHRRMIGTLGPKRPGYVRWTVPQAGQVGFHQRTEYNKRILKIGQNGAEITPKGGFLHYGIVRNDYIVIHGTVPGITKRVVRLREPVRFTGAALKEAPQISYISLESKQGA
jgi:large subunit ribosomal protein L3